MTDTAPQIIIAPEFMTPRVETMELPSLGQTIAQIISAAIAQDKLDAKDIRKLQVYVDGTPLPAETGDQRRAAMRYVPQPGQIINLVVNAQGGGGSGGDKALQTVLQIALVVASFYIGGPAGPLAASAAWIRAAATIAVQVGGQMALQAAFAKDTDKLAAASDKGALQDAANRYRPRAPMPLCLGFRRWGFDLAAPPYTTLIGEDQWLNLAVAPHYGRCWVGNIKLGETLLADYPAADYQIEYFLEPGVPRRSYLYPNRVVQQNLQDLLEKGGPAEVYTSAGNAERIELDVGLPNGLRWNKSSGKIVPQEVQGSIEYQPVAGGAWVAAPIGVFRNKNNVVLPTGNFYIADKTQDPVRRTFGFDLPVKGQYNVRVRVWNPDFGEPEDELTDKTYATALRSIERQLPITDENLSVIFLRVKSTDDLNGNLPIITGEVEPIVPIYQGGNWETEARSSNAAALTRWLLTGPAAAKPASPADFHSSLETTYDLIEANPSWTGSLLVIDEKSQQDVMVGLGKMGRFSSFWNGSKLCFVPDWVRDAPRQVFTGRNAGGYRYRRTFPEPCHAVFVEFLNIDEGSVDDELYVYADGYDATNATLIESFRMDFAGTAARAFQEGRVYLAKRALQVEMHEWQAGIDALATTYGDRVLVRHPATLYGLADGRVMFRRWAGALVSGFRLDEDVEMEDGKTYGIDIRRADGTIRGIPVVTVPGKSRELSFPAPRAAADSPRRGDMVVFGETDIITEDLEIIDVSPESDFGVTLRGIPYIGPLIEGAINNPLPPIVSRVTERVPPPRPRLTPPDFAIPSGLAIEASVTSWNGTPIAGFAGRWRAKVVDAIEGTSVSPWQVLTPVTGPNGILRTGPIVGAANPPDGGQEVTIDIEARTVLVNGEISPSTLIEGIPVLADLLAPSTLAAVGVTRVSGDGSSFGAIAISATPVEVGEIQALEVEVRAAGSADPYVTPTGGMLSARNPVGDLTGLRTGAPGYDLRGRWLQADNWPGPWFSIAGVTIPAGSNVSSDTTHVGGTDSETIADQVAQIPTLAFQLAEARETIYAETTGLVDLTATLFGRLDTPVTGVIARISAVEINLATETAATALRLTALEARAVGTNLLGKSQWFGTEPDYSPWGYYESAVNFAPAVRLTANGYAYPGEGSLQISQGGRNSADPNANLAQFSQVIPAEVGKRYCWSVFSGAIDCRASIIFYFRDAVGALVGGIYEDSNDKEKPGSNPSDISTLKRLATFGTAPAGAKDALLLLRKYDTQGAATAESYAFFSRMMFGEVSLTATIPPPWAAGTLEARLLSTERATVDLATGKADATRVAVLEATASRATYLNTNATFGVSAWVSGTAPANWNAVENIALTSRVAGRVSPYAIRMNAPAATAIRFSSDSPTNWPTPGAGWYVLEVIAEKTSGSWKHSEVELAIYSAGFVTLRLQKIIGLGNEANSQGVVSQDGVAGQLTRFAFLFENPAGVAGTDRWLLNVRNGLARYFAGPTVAADIIFHQISVRPADPTEIETRKARGGFSDLSARIVSIETASATLEGRLEARALLQAVAGNQVAGMQLLAVSGPDVSYSSINFWASSFAVSNNGLNTIAPFEVRGDVVRIRAAIIDRLSVTTAITVGPYAFPVALEARLQPAADGEVISYGGALGQIPTLFFRTEGLAPLGAGETYLQYADSHTETGFIARRKIQTPATPASYNLTGVVAGPGGSGTGATAPSIMIVRGANPVSLDNTYAISGVGDFTWRYNASSAPVEPGQSATATFRVWQRIAGVWSAVGFLSAYSTFDYEYGDGSAIGLTSAPATDVFACSSSVEAWGLSFYSTSGSETGLMAGSMSVAYDAAGTGSAIRSATPAGQRPIIEVRIKNQ